MRFGEGRLVALGVSCVAFGACKFSSPASAVKEDAAPVVGHHTFTVQTKGFIAPIARNNIGTLPPSGTLRRLVFGGILFDPKPAALRAFAAATNLNFSESPPDGTQASGKFRLWAELVMNVTCTGSTLH